MSVYLWIALGGALGSMARYWCQGWAARAISDTFPWGTMTVNIVGCAIIGLFAALTAPEGRLLIATSARQFFMVGICGGFTTFSSFSLETLNLARDGQWARAAANVLGTVIICLVGVWLGHAAGAAIGDR
jgi:fluoride exporter